MERRTIGLIVIGAVLVTTTAGLWLLRPGNDDPLGSGEPTATPTAETATGPPAVGDCVGIPLQGVGTLAYGREAPEYDAVALPVEPCTGPRYAEVVEIIENPADPTEVEARNGRDPVASACAEAVLAYIGPPRTTGAVTWNQTLWQSAFLSGPDEAQVAAGQDWLACLVAPAPAMGGGPEQPADGTLKDAGATGVARELVSHCLDGVAPNGRQTACTAPHDQETFGWNFVDEPLSREELQAGCTDLVAELTGLPDPTADGRLQTLMLTQDRDGDPEAGDPVPTDSSFSCAVTTADGSKLVGSLRGLGDNPVPWQQ